NLFPITGKDQMKAVEIIRKGRRFLFLIASLSFFLIFLPRPSLPVETAPAQEEGPSQPPAQPPVQPPAQPPAAASPPAEPENPAQEGQTAPEETPSAEIQAQPLPPQETLSETEKIEKKASDEKAAGPMSGPPIMLTLKEAIKMALEGNRNYLDRLD